MRHLLPVLLLIGFAGHAQAQQYWYYCDPVHAYYPYVRSCSVPWRQVTPFDYRHPQGDRPAATPAAPTQVAPAQAAPADTNTQTTGPYQQGQADRQAWETWFGALTGDYRDGAEWWADQRSLPHPGRCDASPPSMGADWTAGCSAAQQKLAPWDVRRKTEPEYRLGWNNPPATPPAAPSSADAVNQSPQNASPQSTPITPTIAAAATEPNSESAAGPVAQTPQVDAQPQPAAEPARAADNASGVLAGVGGVLTILFVIGAIVYFLPTVVGFKRGISSAGALLFVNLFFGWTLIGWLICLLWAATGATRAQDEFYRRGGSPR